MLWHANWYHADGWVTDTDWAESDGVAAEPVYEYEPLPGVPDPLVVLRLIDNYVYQTAGEPEEWRPTEAFGFVHALRGVAIGRLLHDSDLPWTVGEDDRDIFLRYGGPDPEPEQVDSDNPDGVELHTRLTATGIPFKATTPQERRVVKRRTVRFFTGTGMRTGRTWGRQLSRSGFTEPIKKQTMVSTSLRRPPVGA